MFGIGVVIVLWLTIFVYQFLLVDPLGVTVAVAMSFKVSLLLLPAAILFTGVIITVVQVLYRYVYY